MKKLLLAIIIVLICFGIGLFSFARRDGFIRGQYGRKCYNVGSEHGNIKYPVYFETLEECLDSLQ